MPPFKEIDIRVLQGSWPNLADVPAGLNSLTAASTLQVDLSAALMFIAIQSRPPMQYGFSLSDCWAWFRYFPAVHSQLRLKLCEPWTSLDPHQKTILSGDFGVGFSTWVLHQALGFQLYGDTLWVLNVLAPGVFQLLPSAKSGPRKSPDYIAMDSDGRFSVLECKGTQSSRKILLASLQVGVPQKQNLRAVGQTEIRHSLVAGIFVPQWESRERALFAVCDPEWVEVKEALGQFSTEEIGRAVLQVALAKELALFDFSSTANALIRAKGADEDLGAALQRDLSVERRAVRVTAEGAVLVQRDYFWSEPVRFADHSISGVRFLGEVPAEHMEVLRGGKRPEEVGERALSIRKEPRWSSSVSNTSTSLVSPFGTRYELQLLETRAPI